LTVKSLKSFKSKKINSLMLLTPTRWGCTDRQIIAISFKSLSRCWMSVYFSTSPAWTRPNKYPTN